jgi:hypothetical protein
MIKTIYNMMRRNLHHDSAYLDWLIEDLADCQTILELGCGSNSPLLKTGISKRTTAMDIWQPYIEKHNKAKDYRQCFKQDILDYDFPPKTYDAVVITDVMEHLPKDKVLAVNLFARMERCAKKKVIIFAPNGFVENDEVDGDPYQAHVSAWEPQDYLSRGFKVRGATGLRYILGKASLPKYKPAFLFAAIAMISQPFIYHRPEIAWHSYAVKELNHAQ